MDVSMPITIKAGNSAQGGALTLAVCMLFALSAAPASAKAEAEAALEVLFGLSTTHFVTEARNENNQLVGIEYAWGHCLTFVNSFDRRSVGCGVGYDYTVSRLSFGARLGAVSGYQTPDFGKHSAYVPCAGVLCVYGSPYLDVQVTQHVALEAIFQLTSVVVGVKFALPLISPRI